MKNNNQVFKLSLLGMVAIAMVHPTLVMADEEEVAALMNPTSTVTVEEIYVSQGSQKFGEYNGLNKQGGYLNGNLNIKGGAGYKKNEEGDTTRWSVDGANLGLSNASAAASISNQGSWNVGVGYDELTHNLSPGYQTPYQGTMGGNRFTLPGNFFPANTSQGGTTNNTNTQTLSKPQLADFQNSDISTTRKNSSFSAGMVIDRSTNITLDFNHLDQSGAKLMAFPSSSWAAPTGTVAAQAVSILPNPTNYQTDTVNLAVNWQGEKSHLTASYFGSFFRDGYNGTQFQTFAGTASAASSSSKGYAISGGVNSNNFETMSTAPSNTLHQFNLNGGYDLSDKTKLTGNLSISRNTQNTSTAVDPYQIGTLAPFSAFNGLVNTSHADFKVIDKSIKDLTLAAGYKFDGHDNLSQSNINNFQSISSAAAYYPNTPLSYKTSVFEASGDYRFTKDQHASLTYQNKYLNQYCNQYATGSNGTTYATKNPAPNISYFNLTQNNYPAGANCVTTPSTITNNITAAYKNRVNEDVNFRLSYGFDVRTANNSTTAIAAFTDPSYIGNSASGNPGVNANNYMGFQPFFEASRVQQIVKGNSNWQATENLSFGLGGKYSYDNYTASQYGVQNANLWSVNIDAAYRYTEEGTVTAYATQQNGMRNLLSYNGTGTFNNNLAQNDTTLGLGFKHSGLLHDSLTLLGDATYSLGQSTYGTQLNYTTSPACTSGTVGTCGTLPTIANRMAAIKLGAAYKVDKHSTIGLRYMYQHLNSNDFYYNGYQVGYTPTSVLPTNQTSGSYNVNVIAASYTYSFD